ncbi:glycosyltransferase [Synechococcus sp. CBW1004]|nr:glycosyltransferase [Synechococcus sp. CBW1004]
MLAIPAIEISEPGRLMQQPVISVLMMTRNHQAYLEQAVMSVLTQQFTEPFELLIGDDASSDQTLQVAHRLQQQHPEHIRVLHAERNVGITANFLRLVAHARAPHLALLEGDDYWIHPEKLTLQLDLLHRHPEAACVAAATANRTPCLPVKPTYTLRDILRRYPVHTSTLVIRAEHLLTYPRFPDIIGWITMLMGYLLARGSCVVLDLTVSFYRRHEGGLWHNADRLNRLRRSRECIDTLDAYFFHRFTHELSSRELWILGMDQAMPQHGRIAHWCQSWTILISQAPRLLRRAPLGFCLLVSRLAIQPLTYGSMLLRRRLALGTRLRSALEHYTI